MSSYQSSDPARGDSFEAQFELDPLQSNTVELTAEAIDWAACVSQSEADIDQQWQRYTRALALKGFHQWLEAGVADLDTDYDSRQAPSPGVNCRVGNFQLCLVAQDMLADGAVLVPAETLDGPEFAHLYILIEVLEEAERITVLSSLRRDRLLAHQRAAGLAPIAGTYSLPTRLFDTEAHRVLLYLSCLNPVQLTEATPTLASAGSAANSTTKLKAGAGRSPLDLETGHPINVGHWLRDQLGAVADSLAWTLMSPLAPGHQMMSASTPEEMLETALREVEPSGLSIPSTARGAYTSLQHVGLPLRLYALIWPILEQNPPEWSLLLFLGSVSGEALPTGTRLVLRDATQTLAEPTLSPGSGASYLYAQAIGEWHEQFTAAVELANGAVFRWPPFVFNPER